MSGLEPERDRVLELAMVATDSQLNILAESEAWVLKQPDALLNDMDDWNKKMHGKSGLIDKVRASTLGEETVEQAALSFVSKYVPKQKTPLCGNSISQDRRFMVRYMPQLEGWFHYRNLDVSTLKELCRRWNPDVYNGFNKKGQHTALADILESIEELRYYRQNFIK